MPEYSEQIVIAMACDEGYAMPLATALRSIAETNIQHWPILVYILTDNFSEVGKGKIQRSLPHGSITLEWKYVSLGQFQEWPTFGHISYMTFARFLLGEHIPPEMERVLYLDSDLLVLADLADLWRKDLNGNAIGAILDSGLDPLIKELHPKIASLPAVANYFNAGVLLIDMRKWKQCRVGDKAIEYLVGNPGTPFADQDALNVVLDGDWQQISENWNFQGHLKNEIACMAETPGIVHFVTSAKPWKREWLTPNEGLFDSYRRRTMYSRGLKERFVDDCKFALAVTRRLLRKFMRRHVHARSPGRPS